MISRVAQVQQQLDKIKALIPANEDIKEYLTRILDLQIASVSPDTPMGVVPPSMLSTTQVYASARIAAELVEEPEHIAEKPEGIVDLGIIEWLLRPALLLRDGLFEPMASGPWQDLASNIVQATARSVCRLDISMQGYGPVHIGTGFVVGQDAEGRFIIMTNAHVIDEAVRVGWPSLLGLKFMCDFARYTTSASGQLLPLADEYRVHSDYDLALVYLPLEVVEEAQSAPLPLHLATQVPSPTVGLHIGVLGHPSFNSDLDPFPKYFGFGNEFGVKRLSPGYIRLTEERFWRHQTVKLFLHDATTLSGSSGSCVLNLQDMIVVGLHFGGWPLPERHIQVGGRDMLAQLFSANGAVPLWLLADDPMLGEISWSR